MTDKKLYVNQSGQVSKRRLRSEIYKRMEGLRQKADYLINAERNSLFWDKLHIRISRGQEREKREVLLGIESQLISLPVYIETWMRQSLENEAAFEFFILQKAESIRSGNAEKDYFWALLIRHDQLVGLTTVLDQLLKALENWVTIRPVDVLNDPVFLGLGEYSVEEQVYLEAEKVHSYRESLGIKT